MDCVGSKTAVNDEDRTNRGRDEQQAIEWENKVAGVPTFLAAASVAKHSKTLVQDIRLPRVVVM